MNIRLSRLYGSNFRSLEAPFSLELPESGSVLLRGLNKDTGDSSASGKSSLVLALSYLFGGCPFPGTELATWGSEEPMVVGASLVGPDGNHRVERGKAGLSVWGPNDEKPIKGKSAESALDRLFGMDSWLRAAATYRGQGQTSLFLGLTDQEKKDFLTRALGLDRYERIAAEAAVQAKARKEELLAAEARWTAALNALQTANDRLAELPALDHQVEIAARLNEAEALKTALEVARTDLAVLVDQDRAIQRESQTALVRALDGISNEQKQIAVAQPDISAQEAEIIKQEDRLTRVLVVDRAREVADTKARQDLKSKIAVAQEKTRHRQALNTEMVGCGEKIAALEQQICPTCERPWVAAALSVELAKLKEKHIELRKRWLEAGEAAEDITAAQKELRELPLVEPSPWVSKIQTILAGLRTEINTARSKTQSARDQALSALDKRRAEAKSTSAQTEEVIRAAGLAAMVALNTQIRETETAYKAVMAAAATAHRADDLVKERRRVVDEAEMAVEINEAEAAELRKSVAAELDLHVMVGREGFLGVIFDDVLAEIAAATNAILARVANVRHVSFAFSSERETDSGTIQRRITPAVTVEGRQVPLTSGISGGQQSGVRLAVDLGVGEVVAKRRGTYPGWLVLDESFDGLGAASKESCIDLLNGYAQDRLVLVIDHDVRFQSQFSRVIDVVSENGRSRIV